MDQSPNQTKKTSENGYSSIPYTWLVVGLALAAQVGIGMPSFGLPVLYPFIREDLHLSHAQLGLITSSLALGGIGTTFLGGWLSDVLGVKKVMVVLFIAVSILMAALPLFSSLLGILFIGILIGAARGPGNPAVARAIMDWVSQTTRGISMSIRLTGGPLAGVLAASILPAIATVAGWHMASILMGCMILLIGIAFFVLYRDAYKQDRLKPRINLATLRTLIENRDLVLATIWGSFFAGLNVILVSYLLLFFTEELEVPLLAAGGYLALTQVASIIARILWGATSDFLLGTRRLGVLGLIGFLAVIGLIGISLVHKNAPNMLLITLMIILGTAMAWPGVFNALIVEVSSSSTIGTTMGAVTTVTRAAVISLPPLFGLLVDTNGSYAIAWLSVALMAFISTMILLIFNKEPRRE